jgi:threonine dehydrogenase-like Zn-dependent dehydrogenase
MGFHSDGFPYFLLSCMTMKALLYQLKPLGWTLSKLLSPFWPKVVLGSLGGLSLAVAPVPQLPGDDWVRVRTLLGGICGTDLAILAQKQPPNSILQAFSSMPMILGHENVAVVEQVGAMVEPSWVGRRVCVEPTLSCVPRGIDPPCHCCQAGQFGACENFGAAGEGKYKLPAGTSIGYNARTGGSMGEFFVAHISQLVPLDDRIPDELAVLTDPLACSLHAALRADLFAAQQVLVYGAGVLGLGVVACLRAIGYSERIDALDRSAHLGDLAKDLGASEFIRAARKPAERFKEIAHRTGGKVHRVRMGNLMLSGGYDVVFDCVGSRQSIEECLKWTTARGQMIMVGTGHGGGADLTPIWFRELTVHGAYGRQIEEFQGRKIGTYQLVHELMLAGKLNVRPMLTNTFRIDQYHHAMETALWKGKRKAIKVAFDFR